MPNHFHAIIKNIGVDPVGADLCVCPGDYQDGPTTEKAIPGKRVTGEHTGSPLHRVIQWATDRENPFVKKNHTLRG